MAQSVSRKPSRREMLVCSSALLILKEQQERHVTCCNVHVVTFLPTRIVTAVDSHQTRDDSRRTFTAERDTERHEQPVIYQFIR